MRFKKLELLGFKSFADHTELIFEPGVTAVVGPNGCGKCLAPSEELLLADGQRWTIGNLVETSLQNASQVTKLDDGFVTTENPQKVSVLSLNPATLKLEPRPVYAFVKRTAPEFMLKIQTRSGREVTATPYHPFFTLKNGQLHSLRADEVEVGVRIATPRILPVTSQNGQLSTGEIFAAFPPQAHIYAPYSDLLKSYLEKLAARYGGFRKLEMAAHLPANALRGIRSRQAVNVAYLSRLIQLKEGSWEDASGAIPLKSKGSGHIRLLRKTGRAAARFLGYLISEGRTTSSHQVWFVNEDPAIVDDFCVVAKEAFGVEAKVFAYKPETKDVLIFSKALCSVLERIYGFKQAGTSEQKRIPSQIMGAPKEVAAEFISALFEGDAYLSARGSMQYVEYAAASRMLAEDLATLLLRFGVRALIRPTVKYASNTKAQTRRLYYSVYIYGVENLKLLAEHLRLVGRKQEALEQFRASKRIPNPNLDLVPGLTGTVRQLTQTSGLHIKALRSASPRLAAYHEGRCEVSRVRIAEMVDLVQRHGTQTSETDAISHQLQRLAESDLYWDEIVSVEQVEPESPWVYDLSVEGTRNFVAKDIIVHNSNISDAIKWVLGEQSAKELRGGRMEDLIFNGSANREPINFAEVSLTLDNSDKQLPIEFSEVTISRRLFRSGESVYFLNRAPVRLREIQQLLLGTGIGSSAYSLFEQGRIDQVISARPEDRRAIFEEAAGITKYKGQKREALRRLDETEQNLARVTDIIAEVRRQLQAIERQVKRAKAYQEKHDVLKKKEFSIASYKGATLQTRREAQAAVLHQHQIEQSAIEAELASQEESLSGLRGALQEADEALQQVREGRLNMTHQRESVETSLQVSRDRMEDAASRQMRSRQELEQARGQLREMEQKKQELEALMSREVLQRESTEQKVQVFEMRLKECSDQMEQAQKAIAASQQAILEETAIQVQLKNQVSKVRQESARMEARDVRLKMEGTKVAAEKEEVVSQVHALVSAMTDIRRSLEQTQGRLGICEGELSQALEQVAGAQQTVYGLEQEMTKLGSQLELLKNLAGNH